MNLLFFTLCDKHIVEVLTDCRKLNLRINFSVRVHRDRHILVLISTLCDGECHNLHTIYIHMYISKVCWNQRDLKFRNFIAAKLPWKPWKRFSMFFKNTRSGVSEFFCITIDFFPWKRFSLAHEWNFTTSGTHSRVWILVRKWKMFYWNDFTTQFC